MVPQNLKNRVFLSLKIQKFSGGRTPRTPLLRTPLIVYEKNYTAVIRPRIACTCAVWSGGPTQRLQRLQDSFLKRHGIMLPPLQKRFNYHTLVLLYRIREKLAPDHLFSLLPSLISSTSGYSLRKHSYPVPFTKKSATLNSFLPRAIILWNTLPFDVQSSKSLSMFKSKLKTHLS